MPLFILGSYDIELSVYIFKGHPWKTGNDKFLSVSIF